MAVNRTLLAFIALGAAVFSNAHQVVALEMKPVLPTDLAIQAAQQAVDSCEKKGFAVTATVGTSSPWPLWGSYCADAIHACPS